MQALKKICNLNVWNIGFIEQPVSRLMKNDRYIPRVNWLRHPYKDRFFADPFFLSVSDDKMVVLVEEYLYNQKRGKISRLTVSRDYSLIDKITVSDQAFHQSYPFVFSSEKKTFVMPEASKSGSLYLYEYDFSTDRLVNQRLMVSEPLVDSTLMYKNDYWWLFAHKRGQHCKNNLYIFYAKSLNDTFLPHKNNPVIRGDKTSRPGGKVVSVNEKLYRVTQVCENSYGEALRIFSIGELSPNGFEQTFIKEIRLNDGLYSKGFHTLNGMKDMCVLDGLKTVFTPLRRFWYELVFRTGLNP